jgi:molecular chaperone HtpG
MPSSLLEYPELFEEKLKANRRVRSAIDSSLTLVSDILQISKLPFFPDYTDHGAPHLNKVLEIAERLIAEGARNLFSAEDTAVLTFSALLHDLALHLTEAGFQSLLKAPRWAGSWREFLTTAKHWDDRKLIEVFGADETGAPQGLVKDPFDHYKNLTEADRKLIGEFIRQEHPQLAYEFATAGFPGADGRVIPFGPFDQDLRELAGIIARSHGFHLRDGIRQLEQMQFNKLEHTEVHPVFLMGILRISDFLDLGENRAPLIAFAYKEFKSTISVREWRTNQAFRTISWGNPDPESIFIPARPTDVFSYLELKQWLAAIQSELDMAWAVFGEVYGAHPKFSHLGLAIRRVHSNITDDPEAFARTASFVPKRIEIGVAGPDVLKLLIEPLYGDRPEIGIRELIQNAVDAVRERWAFEKNHSRVASQAPSDLRGDVVVWLDDPDENGVAMLTVSDRGTGMTEEIIVNYFLKAGASFRRSLAWKKEFESEEGASQGHSKSRVLRSGRFGIGVLAAFLLGDEIEVSTRHINSKRGIRFTVRLDLRPAAFAILPIQLTYISGMPAGTTVKIKVKTGRVKRGEETDNNLFSQPKLWDWYCLAAPSVLRLRGRKETKLKQSFRVPAEKPTLPRGWHRVASSDYRNVHVLLDPKRIAHKLAVNGIVVIEANRESSPWEWFTDYERKLDRWEWMLRDGVGGTFGLRVPEFSIFDPDGNLPLNLQRTELTHSHLDFMAGAFEAQAKAALALLLISVPEIPTLSDAFVTTVRSMFQDLEILPVFFTQFGAGLVTQSNLQGANVKNCLMVGVEQRRNPQLRKIQCKYDATIFFKEFDPQDFEHDRHPPDPLDSLPGTILNVREWGSAAYYSDRGDRKSFESGLIEFATANCPPTKLTKEDRTTLKEALSAGRYEDLPYLIAAEVWLGPSSASTEKPVKPRQSVGRLWSQIIKESVIPFDPIERRSKLSHAYAALGEYVADFASQKARKRRKS